LKKRSDNCIKAKTDAAFLGKAKGIAHEKDTPLTFAVKRNLRSICHVPGVHRLVQLFFCSSDKSGTAATLHGGPITVFTNVAAHLLRAQLNLELDRIQLYPTMNTVRLSIVSLQIAANLYDSTTNRTLTSYPYCLQFFAPCSQ